MAPLVASTGESEVFAATKNQLLISRLARRSETQESGGWEQGSDVMAVHGRFSSDSFAKHTSFKRRGPCASALLSQSPAQTWESDFLALLRSQESVFDTPARCAENVRVSPRPSQLADFTISCIKRPHS